MRSAQFGVYENTIRIIRNASGGPIESKDKLFGFIDVQVVLAGFAGGIGRGVVEGPFENIKVTYACNTQYFPLIYIARYGLIMFIYYFYMFMFRYTGAPTSRQRVGVEGTVHRLWHYYLPQLSPLLPLRDLYGY